jgi:hypothetical protein
MIGLIAAASVIAAVAIIVKAMISPAVTVAPTGPGTHAKEDPVEEVSFVVKAHRSAGVGWSFIVAVRADRWSTHFDVDLCFRRRHQNQAREQCCCTEEDFESAHK